MLHALAALPPLDMPPLWRWATKWGYFLALAALLGSTFTHVAVVRPALRHADPDDAQRVRTRSYRIVGASALVMVAAALTQSVSAVARGAKVDITAAIAPSQWWAWHLGTPKKGDWIASGWLSLAQLGTVLVVAALLAGLLRARPSPRWERALVAAVPLTWVITLVKSVPSGPTGTTLDAWVSRVLVQSHIIGGSLWAGGLLALARATWTARDSVVATWLSMWQRFGVVAMASVGAIVVSGAWLTYREVGSPSQMLTTSFGIVLTAKLLLVALLLAAGGYNQLVVLPHLVRDRRAGDAVTGVRLAVHHLGQIVAVEVVAIAGVLLAVALLNGSARAQAGGHEPPPVDATLLLAGTGVLAATVLGLVVVSRLADAIARRGEPQPA